MYNTRYVIYRVKSTTSDERLDVRFDAFGEDVSTERQRILRAVARFSDAHQVSVAPF